MTGKILISACLNGEPVRYDGQAKKLEHPIIAKWRREGRLVSICPELVGGFQVPRLPAEIEPGRSGADVLEGKACVFDNSGRDVTGPFVKGAEAALALAVHNDCKFALLIDRSPSCGSSRIYNGTFSGELVSGEGVTAALLRANGVAVFSETQITDLDVALTTQESEMPD